jgi:hypothetical protein
MLFEKNSFCNFRQVGWVGKILKTDKQITRLVTCLGRKKWWGSGTQLMKRKINNTKSMRDVYCSTIHNSQVIETAKMPHYWQMD